MVSVDSGGIGICGSLCAAGLEMRRRAVIRQHHAQARPSSGRLRNPALFQGSP
jgi:hypothetical protein